MRGRRPIPTAIKRLKGTLRPHRENRAEPAYAVGVPAPPREVLRGAIERRVWREATGVLAGAKVLTTADGQVVARLCVLTARLIRNRRAQQKAGWPQTIEESDAQGNIKVRKHPLLSIENDTLRELRAIESELGLTPATRSRVKALDQAEPTATPLEQLQRQAAGLRRVK